MERLIYKTGKTEITIDVTDLSCNEFLNHTTTIMRMLWHSVDNIAEAMDDWDDSKFIL